MSIRRGSMYAVHRPIERAQAHGTRSVIKCEVRLTSPNSHPGTKIPSLRQVGIDRQTAIHKCSSIVELVGYKSERISTHALRHWVICTQMHGFPGQPRSFGALLGALDHPPTCLPLHVAPRRHAIGA